MNRKDEQSPEIKKNLSGAREGGLNHPGNLLRKRISKFNCKRVSKPEPKNKFFDGRFQHGLSVTRETCINTDKMKVKYGLLCCRSINPMLINGGALLILMAFIFEKKKQFLLCQFRRCSDQGKTPKTTNKHKGCQRVDI